MSVHDVDVKSEGRYHLVLALRLAMNDHYGPSANKRPSTVSHWRVADGAITFGWNESLKGSVPLPAPMQEEMVADLVLGWLTTAEYGAQPDHDGDNERGWHVTTSSSTYDPYATFHVRPYWIEYSK